MNIHLNDSEMRYFLFDLPLSESAWLSLELPSELRTARPPADLYALHAIADAANRKLHTPLEPDRLALLGALNEVFAFVAEGYLHRHHLSLDGDRVTLDNRAERIEGFSSTLEAFVELFPPAAVKLGRDQSATFLEHGDGRRHQALAQLFVLAVQYRNPALVAEKELFCDALLQRRHGYLLMLERLERLARTLPEKSNAERPLLDLLALPLRECPHDLADQVAFVQKSWGQMLPETLRLRLQLAEDFWHEHHQPRGGGPGPVELPNFSNEPERQRFSADADWMPNVVLIAKSIHVWLDQLSKKYDRPIRQLNDIPDAELDRLRRWNFSGLWLIGIWERSNASRRIKQQRGNPDAVASAYSLYDYKVADDLGGEEALDQLRERCLQRGLRLACDVVPNHTGIYSRWVIEHPDWYIQAQTPPFPAYRFTGPDLSENPDVSIVLEDGYWDHSDAAVVFKHVDHRTGRARFIYHGNDGTHLPWNDTAQLNFLLSEVREAVEQTIIDIAHRFPIIRFDAAMTLAKKHFQRLWYPQPGGGAGVPSRAAFWMSRQDFDRAFPVEFWRQVVDRVAAEVPDTLLLAEAFWLMEGYFVRTLGMHRVYNSAFMNMLKTEDNARYRSVIKSILEFDPQILKRFVNFMSNPDEATAIEQFGTGDKYFGTAVLLSTLPGLPMFAHGQIEGLREKYGMEYPRAYWDEQVDDDLLRHHERLIFPLLGQRRLFSEADHFVLYDFLAGEAINEDVFAFSNRSDGHRALIIFHNRAAETAGRIRTGCAHSEGEGPPRLSWLALVAALDLETEQAPFWRFRDHCSGLHYLLPTQQLRQEGLVLRLGPYQHHVFVDFEPLFDPEGHWQNLWRELQGQPVPDLDAELGRRRYAGLHRVLIDLLSELSQPDASPHIRARELAQELIGIDGPAVNVDRLHADLSDELARLPDASESEAAPIAPALLLLKRMRRALPEPPAEWFDRLLLHLPLTTWLHECNPSLSDFQVGRLVALLRTLLQWQSHSAGASETTDAFKALCAEEPTRRFLGVNRHAGCDWFSKEGMDLLFEGLRLDALLKAPDAAGLQLDQIMRWVRVAEKSAYRLDKFLQLL